jgi:hypothetical protein
MADHEKTMRELEDLCSRSPAMWFVEESERARLLLQPLLDMVRDLKERNRIGGQFQDQCQNLAALNKDLERQISVAIDRSEEWKSMAIRYKELSDARGEALDSKRFRDGLLRIAARCGDWSPADVRANVADLLGCKVEELER